MGKYRNRCTDCRFNVIKNCGKGYQGMFQTKQSVNCSGYESDTELASGKKGRFITPIESKPKVRVHKDKELEYFFYV